MIEKKGSAKWQGSLKEGKGRVMTETGALDAPYGFRQRFEGEAGTNPEEILGAAHSACFSMALANILAQADMTPDSIETTATVTLDASSLTITKVHLDVRAKIANADEAAFQDAAKKAKEGCPVSKLFKADISMDAKLA
ncbi:OsmC family peroxiredoxin [Silicimonas algicola]|uniref:Osmotically inducible protein OsmC n=1 Tax=Silicimonas algicola TaxID=1826607 RepID=A0A316G9C0_9RHOB|nr:OsmC family protein [Silicimonas algicola]AZQ68040.1 OsmC family peroxiredoxin [Silicimonas algicola]PWK57511.1 osmotically inducible protein OsmC [Silicimonas algicola]